MVVLAFISTALSLMLSSFIAGVCIGKRVAKKEE